MSLKYVGVPQAFLRQHKAQIDEEARRAGVGGAFQVRVRDSMSKLGPIDDVSTIGEASRVYAVTFEVWSAGRDGTMVFPVSDGPDQIVAWYQRNKVTA